MLSLVSATVTETTFSQTSHKSAPSPVIIKLFKAIHWVHKTWHWHRKGKIYTQRENLVTLAAGHIVNFFAGKSETVRVAATCVYIASRILACIVQYHVLASTCTKVSHAFRGSFPQQQRRKWTLNSNLVSPSTRNSICKFGNQVSLRLKQTALCIIQVFKEIFILSMTMLDAITAFYFNPEDSKEQISELFVNADQTITDLSQNQTMLVNNLRSNAPIINRVLKVIKPDTNADELIASINKNIGRAAAIRPHWGTAKARLENFGKRVAAGGYMFTLGREPPAWTVPTQLPESPPPSLSSEPKPGFVHSRPNPRYQAQE